MPIMVPPIGGGGPGGPPLGLTGLLRYEIIDRNGIIHDMTWNNNQELYIPAGSIGLGDLTFNIEDTKLPMHAGRFLQRINTEARKITIPIVINKRTFMEVIDTADTIYDWFDSGDEAGYTPIALRVTRMDGTQRQISCYYVSGLEGDLGEGSPNFVKMVAELYCPDPAPTDIAETVYTPAFSSLGSFTVINNGRLKAYPRWQVLGPFTGQVNIANVGTGDGISVLMNLPASTYLFIDTRPGDQRGTVAVYDSSGTNRTPNLHPMSKLFQLDPGTNTIQITFGGGTTGATVAAVTFLQRHRGMLR